MIVLFLIFWGTFILLSKWLKQLTFLKGEQWPEAILHGKVWRTGSCGLLRWLLSCLLLLVTAWRNTQPQGCAMEGVFGLLQSGTLAAMELGPQGPTPENWVAVLCLEVRLAAWVCAVHSQFLPHGDTPAESLGQSLVFKSWLSPWGCRHSTVTWLGGGGYMDENWGLLNKWYEPYSLVMSLGQGASSTGLPR